MLRSSSCPWPLSAWQGRVLAAEPLCLSVLLSWEHILVFQLDSLFRALLVASNGQFI